MESSSYTDVTFDSHIISTLRINTEEVFNLYLQTFPNMNNTNFRARVSETGQVDPEESSQVSQNFAAGGPPFREFGSNTLRSSSSGVAPLQTGVHLQLGYGTFTPNLRAEGELYLGSPPGASQGNKEQQTLEYGYGTAWIQDYMTRGGAVPRRRHRLDTLVEIPEVTPQDTQHSMPLPSNDFNDFMRQVPSSTPVAGNASVQQVLPGGVGGIGAAAMHLDYTAQAGNTRWRGGRARRLSYQTDQEHLLPDLNERDERENGDLNMNENVDLGFSDQNGLNYDLRGVEQEISELFNRAQNLHENQAQYFATLAGTQTPHTDTHPNTQNFTSHSHSHSQPHSPSHTHSHSYTSQEQGQRPHHSGRR